MGELTAIEKTSKPNTADSLRADFQALGLAAGDTVIVHAAMSSIGWVCGEQVAVVQALMDVLGEAGTLVMPAHTAANSDPAEWENPPVPADWVETIRQTMPAFDKRITPTRSMGKIAEVFRTWPGTLRSDHPHVSFAAHGRLAADITATHVLTPFFGMDTPLGALYRLRAKVLLLGVGYGNCTAFHLAEVCSHTPATVAHGCAMLEDGQRVWKWFDDCDYDSDDFTRIGEAYEVSQPVVRGKVGCADCRLLDMHSAVDFATAWMLENREK